MAGGTLAAMAAMFAAMARTAPAAERDGREAAGRVLRRTARGALGDYQDAAGPFPAWAPLAESTKADRVRQGFTPDDPLLRSGELRSSIFSEVDGDDVHVFSNHEVAPYQEFGTSRIPPRPFLGPAVVREGEAALDQMARRVLRGWG